jgi:hypothetical protein
LVATVRRILRKSSDGLGFPLDGNSRHLGAVAVDEFGDAFERRFRLYQGHRNAAGNASRAQSTTAQAFPFTLPKDISLEPKEWLIELTAFCKQPVVWIAFDTLNRVLGGGDENSSKDMGAVIASIDRIQRETNAHCSLVHHVPHDRNDRMRGHGSVLGAVDMTVRITKDGDTVNLEVDKANDLVDKPRYAFTFKSVVLCFDPDTGTETSAPVMVPMAIGPAAAKAKPTKRLPPSAKIALRAFTEALDRHGEPAPGSTYIPAKARVVTEEHWRAVCNRIGISSGERRAKERAFGRARDKLVADQIIGTYEGLYWAGRA